MKNLFKTIVLALSLFSAYVLADVININTATKAELMRLNGIGETKAKAIIKYRKKSKFKSLADIKDVSGIGDKIYQDNSRKMKLSGKTKVTHPAARPASAKNSVKVSKTKPKKKPKTKSGKTQSKK